MFPFLDALPPDIRPAIETVGGGIAALLLALVPYLVIKKFAKKTPNTESDTPSDDIEPTRDDAAERPPLLGPLCAWFGLSVGIGLAFLLVVPRESWGAVYNTNDAGLRTIHAFTAACLATLLALVPGVFMPRAIACAWRTLLFAGVGVSGVWFMGAFLVDNGIWTGTKFWTVASIAGVSTGLIAATIASPLERTHAPALTTLSASGLLGLSAAPAFYSTSATMAHTLGAAAIALALLAGATLSWKDLGRSCVAPLLALGVLVPAIVIPAVYDETMLVATLVPLALAPLTLVVHRLPIVERLPGPAWILPALLQLVALVAVIGTSAAFATGVLEVTPENAPWHEGAPADDDAGDDPYADPGFYD